MAGHGFDSMARDLAGTASRRAALRLVAGAAAAGVLGRLSVRDAAAGASCRIRGKRCNHNTQCCSLRRGRGRGRHDGYRR